MAIRPIQMGRSVDEEKLLVDSLEKHVDAALASKRLDPNGGGRVSVQLPGDASHEVLLRLCDRYRAAGWNDAQIQRGYGQLDDGLYLSLFAVAPPIAATRASDWNDADRKH